MKKRVIYSLYIDIPKEELDLFDKDVRGTRDIPINYNTKNQVKLFFETEQDAVDYAELYNINFKIMKPQKRKLKLKSYADNFAFDKYENWTH